MAQPETVLPPSPPRSSSGSPPSVYSAISPPTSPTHSTPPALVLPETEPPSPTTDNLRQLIITRRAISAYEDQVMNEEVTEEQKAHLESMRKNEEELLSFCESFKNITVTCWAEYQEFLTIPGNQKVSVHWTTPAKDVKWIKAGSRGVRITYLEEQSAEQKWKCEERKRERKKRMRKKNRVNKRRRKNSEKMAQHTLFVDEEEKSDE